MLIPLVHVLCFKHLLLPCLASLLVLVCVRKISTPLMKYLRDTREGNASEFQSMALASFVTCSDTRQEVDGEPVIEQIWWPRDSQEAKRGGGPGFHHPPGELPLKSQLPSTRPWIWKVPLLQTEGRLVTKAVDTQIFIERFRSNL